MMDKMEEDLWKTNIHTCELESSLKYYVNSKKWQDIKMHNYCFKIILNASLLSKDKLNVATVGSDSLSVNGGKISRSTYISLSYSLTDLGLKLFPPHTPTV
jgi:hypothetical protein